MGDGFLSLYGGIPLPYLRYARHRNYGNGYVVITSVGVSVVGGRRVCALGDVRWRHLCCSVAVLQFSKCSSTR